MPVMRTYECPDCTQTFDYLHLRMDEGPPNFCPNCGNSMLDAQPELPRINLSTNKAKSIDNVYTDMERGSEIRAEMAAEHLGESSADTSAMKITDMKTGLKEGDSSIIPVNNPVSQMMAQTGIGGLQSADAASSFAASVNTGPYARAGNQARASIVSGHQQRAAAMAHAGNQGTFVK